MVLVLSAAANADPPAASREILVKLRPGAAMADARALNRRSGVRVVEKIEALGIYRLEIPAGSDLDAALDTYRRDPLCEDAEKNHRGQGGFVPDDTWYPFQWHLHNTGQTAGTPDADIDAPEGWEITRGDPGIVIAILDTGIDPSHAEFQGRVLPGYDFVNEDPDPSTNHEHGPSVTGLAAATGDNAFSVAGVDHAATILPVKVLDDQNSGDTFDLAQGLVFAADSGADVISMSLINYPSGSSTLNAALQYARDAGAILIACAGNGGIGDADFSGPGVSPLTISVANTDHDDQRAPTAGTGAALDLVAPGHIVTTIDPQNPAGQTFFGGCSAATPVTAGVATLLLSVDPTLTHDEVRTALVAGAEDQVGPPGEDLPGRDDFFGWGRVNLYGSLLTLLGVSDCFDGVDNDADGFFDFPADPGCRKAAATTEVTACQDGIDNDPGQDPTGLVDFDGGQSIHGPCSGSPGGCPPGVSDPDGDGVANPDPQCVGKPWKDQERSGSCGLGFELAFVLPLLGRLRQARTRR